MDNIIELILNNIVFVIIAIGGILSFFKRMGNEDQNQNQQQNERPRRQAAGPGASRPPQQREEASDEIQSENVSAYKEALERISERENAQYDIKVQKPKRSSAKQKGISVSKRNVQNGIIWAEILGPPRSRRPHPSMTTVKQSKR
ncbi:hypothetical protein [Pseudalkalibacillus hwajinpoensis]|uniref:Uncharacterized protein n=1 Tax=Guptibacillus hwajinpoensis TaxID=208199 RepID=A0A4U1MI96_9BACL|nr:hypothetical protein [Pseudalkalibacillus hwajinpoensis]TKD70172.1 hypothetical protein FBF83_13080 [Pseudalkalibacillus hwajinpoensis]